MRDLNMNEIDMISGGDRSGATAVGAAGFGVAGAVEGAKIGGSMGLDSTFKCNTPSPYEVLPWNRPEPIPT